MRKNWSVLVVGLGALVLVAWLNAYRYDSIRGLPYRTNRFTGRVEKLMLDEGWVRVVKPTPQPESQWEPIYESVTQTPTSSGVIYVPILATTPRGKKPRYSPNDLVEVTPTAVPTKK
jgi:hypothetical protein